ncbi:teichoic acid biosynthesis protein C [Streptomyces sp. NPDC056930]|uniref:phage baseplate protein n=1 Tax=Streptomyces sp. NPDC056930 TaxID=3345967 RepID=UPI0036342B24
MSLSLSSSPGRRAVLGFGAAVALTATFPAGRAEARPKAQPASLAPAGKPWIRGVRLRHSTVLQSFAFDERHGHMYALQVMGGGVRLPGEPRAYTHAERAARGDMCLNRLTMGGALTGDMYLLGFGHGSALGVEDTARRAGALWTEWDAQPASGYGRGICRFTFTAGRVLTRAGHRIATHRPLPGSTNNQVTLDPAHDRLLLRYKVGGVPRYGVYGLKQFAAGDFRPVTGFAQPGAELGLPFQGMALYGPYAYQVLGHGYSADNPAGSAGDVRLFRIDVRTGRVVQRVLDHTARGLYPREPEGLAVLRRGGPWLCLGFTQGPPSNRTFSLYYKPIAR